MHRKLDQNATLKTDCGEFKITFTFWCEKQNDHLYFLFVKVTLPRLAGPDSLLPFFVNPSQTLCGENLTENWRSPGFTVRMFKICPTVNDLENATRGFMDQTTRQLVEIINVNNKLSSRLRQALEK